MLRPRDINLIKQYPKDRKHRSLKLPDHLVKKIECYVTSVPGGPTESAHPGR